MGRKSRGKRERRAAEVKEAHDLLRAAPQVQAYVLARELAFEVHRQSAAKYKDAPDDIMRAALLVISQDAVITHGAILTLVRQGYASSAAANLRTMFDLLIAVGAIFHSKNPKLMAFRYFYSGHRELARDDKRFDSATRRAPREEMRKRIKSLPEQEQADALGFLKEKDRAYFFGEEWQKPSDVLALFPVPDLAHIYGKLSSAAHGGFFGMRLFRDNPDDRGVAPQVPPRERALSLVVSSSRLLVEISSFRGVYEGLDVEKTAQALREDFRTIALDPL